VARGAHSRRVSRVKVIGGSPSSCRPEGCNFSIVIARALKSKCRTEVQPPDKRVNFNYRLNTKLEIGRLIPIFPGYWFHHKMID